MFAALKHFGLLGFRQKILLLAVVLVVTTQVITLIPVLSLFRGAESEQELRTVGQAGVVLDDFMRAEADRLIGTAGVLAADYGFKQAIASGDRSTIRSALVNQSQRAGASVAYLVDLDGSVIASSRGEEDQAAALPWKGEIADEPPHRVAKIGGVAYQMVTVPVRMPLPVAGVVLEFPIDTTLVTRLAELTGLGVTVLSTEVAPPEILASSVVKSEVAAAITGLDPTLAGPQRVGTDDTPYLTLVRPMIGDESNVRVALQLPLRDAMSQYLHIRNMVLFITLAALVFALLGSVWIASTISRPVRRLADAARRMREGIYTEYIALQSPDELGELAGRFNAMQSAIADREREISHRARHDSLTGLPNRDLTIHLLNEALANVGTMSVVSVELNRLEGIISSLGHHVGDDFLKSLAAALRGSLEEGDVLGHFGDHRFIVGLPHRNALEAVEWLKRRADLLRSGEGVEGRKNSLQISGGVASYPEHGVDAVELCRHAGGAHRQALLAHRTAGVYRIGQTERERRQIRLVNEFPLALQSDAVRLYVQPKLDLRTRRICGAEGLVRWQHPELGFLSPAEFVDAIEQAGDIVHLTRWVLRAAVAQCAAWRDRGLLLGVAVNISVDDLADESLPSFLFELMRTQGLPASSLTLEVTESTIMHNVEHALAVVQDIRDLGFRLSVDDFGTGHSALAQLRRLPADELKIDKSFLIDRANAKDVSILRATINLAHDLGLVVVAEGIEDDPSLERIAAMGCEYAQGFGIARPMPAEQFPEWLERYNVALNNAGAARASPARMG
jgi:diguanylate cyclase (GGDEF)-like protein